MICPSCGKERDIDFKKIPSDVKMFDVRCENCGAFIMIRNPNYNSEKFEVELSKIIRNSDPFFNVSIKKYFEENCRECSVDDKIKLLRDLSIDMDVFNEFTKYVMKKTYDINNSININGITAKDIANSNPTKNGIEVYLELAKQKGEFEEKVVSNSIENSELVYNHSKGLFLQQYRLLFEFVITKDFIYRKMDGKSIFIKDNDIINKSLGYIQRQSDEIIRLSEEAKKCERLRQNLSDKITIKKNNNLYTLNKGVNSMEIQNFYDNLVNELENIIN